jgi:hypothetical protein
VGLLRYLNPLRILDRRGWEEKLEDAASPADRVTSAEEDAADRSRDERAEVLQDEAERLEQRADAGDAAELKQATDRAVAERRNVEGD